MNKSESNMPWWMKSFIIIICLFLLVALLLNWNNTLPDIKIPITKMPNPNAYDYFLAASNSLVDKETIDGANSSEPTIPINSSVISSSNFRFPTEVEKAKALKNNSKALNYLRMGLEYEYKTPQVRSISEILPYSSSYRRLTRLLLIESKSYETKKNWNAAMQSRLDGLEYGVKISDGSNLMSMLMCVALEAISRKDINIVNRNLNAKESINAAKRLEKILNKRVPYINSIEEEKNNMIRSYMDIFQKPRWQNYMTRSIMDYYDETDDYKALKIKSKLTTYGKRSIMNGLIGFYDEYIEISNKPYTVKPPVIAVPKDPMNQVFCGCISQDNRERFHYEKTRTLDYILLLELALRAYKLENGTYPENLEKLTSKYLTKLPNDPFALKGTLKYQKKGDKYLLYSIGPDCKDDGGRPITYSANVKAIDKDSKGDIVAGINNK